MSVETQVHEAAKRARTASITLGTATRGAKDAALLAMAQALLDRSDDVVAANGLDIDRAVADQTPEHMLDRLRLDASRVNWGPYSTD